MPPTRAAPGPPSASRPTWRWGSRGTGCVPATPSSRESSSTARCRGPRAWPRRTTSTMRTRGSPPHDDSGGDGWERRGSQTIAGAIRSSARRWRSRASPTCRPVRRWRRSRPRCPKLRVGSATGTTGSAGCGIRPSPSRRCTTWASIGRRTSSCSSSPIWSRTRTARCRSCTGSTAAVTSPRPSGRT